jgi:hypothetical protein
VFRAHLIHLAAQLWIQFDHPGAAAWVESWISNSIDYSAEVWGIIVWSRNGYVAGLRGDGTALERARAIGFLTRAVEQASTEFATYIGVSALDEAQLSRAQAAVRIIDAATQQLYFASGAFHSGANDNEPRQMTIEERRTFLAETVPILRQLGEHASANTIHHLIELLEYLVPADPAAAFDLIAHAVLNGGKAGGYALEVLGTELMVRLLGQYLADFKDVFEAPERRQALIDCLEIFSAAGWPAVRRLLYRLPEFFQ